MSKQGTGNANGTQLIRPKLKNQAKTKNKTMTEEKKESRRMPARGGVKIG